MFMYMVTAFIEASQANEHVNISNPVKFVQNEHYLNVILCYVMLCYVMLCYVILD